MVSSGYNVFALLFMFLVYLFWFVSEGSKLAEPSLLPPNAFGDLYLALGNLSVRLNMFLLSLMVFNIISALSSLLLTVYDTSSGKNFLINDSIMGKERICSHVGL